MGSHSTIGGNVFLTHSVPPDSLVYYEETQLKIVAKKHGAAAGGGSEIAAAISYEI